MKEPKEFKRKPTSVLAMQFLPGENATHVLDWLFDNGLRRPEDYTIGGETLQTATLTIKTINGTCFANYGDWIIQEQDKSGFYVCTNEKFGTLYEVE